MELLIYLTIKAAVPYIKNVLIFELEKEGEIYAELFIQGHQQKSKTMIFIFNGQWLQNSAINAREKSFIEISATQKAIHFSAIIYLSNHYNQNTA